MAAYTGMPAAVVPPHLPPPPPPPAYGVSTPPNPSPKNVGTSGSAVGVESPEETLHRIAHGVFGGPVIATESRASNYSPQDDDFPLF
uniref:Uncharacterized protein n=1 Tax=Arundo donax TaxID=35708 RepID=A0A0A9B7D6_ARUDO